MSDVTQLTLLALDGLFARSQAIAHNIANSSTPNYRPVRVSFEESLAAVAASKNGDASEFNVTFHEAEGSLRLDLELAGMTMTAGRYAALLDFLGSQVRMQSLAMSSNRA